MDFSFDWTHNQLCLRQTTQSAGIRKQKKLNISLQKYKIVNRAGNGPTPMALHWGTHNVAWF